MYAEDRDVDFSVMSKDGMTLLHVVAGRQRCKQVAWKLKFLLSKGLDPKSEDELRRTPLDNAAANKLDDILELFQKQKEPGQ